MATKRLYSVLDMKSGLHGPIMQFNRDGEAIRALESTVNGEKSNHISRNPEDFQLHFLGEFNEETGIITGSTGKDTFVAHAVQLVKSQK